MKTQVNPELLARCLDDVESGRMTIEECMAAHPAVAEDLRSLLEVASAIVPPSPVTLDPSFRYRGRAALLAAITADRETVTKSPLRRLWGDVFDGWRQPAQLLVGRMGMPALIVALVVALTSVAGGSAVYAAQGALPGEALYQIKTTVEEAQLALARDDEAKAQAYLNRAARRLVEIEKASERGNTYATTAAARAFVEDLARADDLLIAAAAGGEDVYDLAARLQERLERQQMQLATVRERARDETREALGEAAEAAERGLTLAGTRAIESRVRTESKPGRPITDTVGVDDRVGPPPWANGAHTPALTGTITNTVAVTFTQTVSQVLKLEDDPNVPGQSYKGLLSKLRAAEAALERSKEHVAVNVLDAFLHHLNAMAQSGHISAEDYEELYASYCDLVKALGGTPESAEAVAAPNPPGTPNGKVEAPGRKDDKPSGNPSAPTSNPDGERGRPDKPDKEKGKDSKDAQAQPNTVLPQSTATPVPSSPSPKGNSDHGTPDKGNSDQGAPSRGKR